MLVVTLIACLLCIDTAGEFSLHYFTAPLLTSFLICWPTSFLPRKWRSPIQIFLGEFVIALCITDVYCLIFFGTSITPSLYQTVIQTDAREFREFFRIFVGWNILREWRILCLLSLAMLLPLLYLPWLWTVPAIMKLRSLQLNHRIARFGLLAVGITTLAFETVPTWHYLRLFAPSANLIDTEGFIFRKYHQKVPTPLHRMAFAMRVTAQSKQTLRAIKASSFSATIARVNCTPAHIVLVIGESYNKHHSSLYGYPLPTTPNQQQRMENDELILFSDAVTPWNITSSAFLCMFSIDGIGSPLLPILFRRAGYTVRFFSNQFFIRTPFECITNQAGNFFLSDWQLSDSIFDYRNECASKYDIGLVQQVQNYRNDHYDSLTLDIIHLLGQHFDYSKRYPKDMARFTTADYQHRHLDNEAMQQVMQYDNATFYNDFVVESIIKIYENEDAVVIYLSDHGEEIYDGLPLRGRQFGTPNAVQARNEFEVPMWVWCSQNFYEKHPLEVYFLKKNAHKPFYTANLSKLLLHLVGIPLTDGDSKRIIGGEIDYDQLMLKNIQ